MQYHIKIKKGRKLWKTKQNWTDDLFNNILREIENIKNIYYKRWEIILIDI